MLISSYISSTRPCLIFFIFIPNKNINCNDKDPPWFNNQIKKLTEKKSHLFKSYMAIGRLPVDRVRLQKADTELINIIKSSKENFTTTSQKN